MSDSAMSLPSTSEEESSPPQDLSASGITIPSDSEAFSSLSQPSTSPPQSSVNNTKHDDGSHEQKVVIYSRPTFWTLLRGAAINLLLPFVNGMMLGLGELLAHEIAFRWGWGTMQIFPKHRASRTVGPGVEMREDPVERRKRQGITDPDLMDATSLE